MRLTFAAISAATFLIATAPSGSAASLQVSPTSLDIAAPGTTTTITLNNPGDIALKAQIRVYRWSLVNGEEHLEPATDVVASPPIASLQPKADYVVRVVRTSKAPIAAEETYRLVVDEIPERKDLPTRAVVMAFRYSIPVFFQPAAGGTPNLAWSVQTRNGKTYLSATNTGTRRVRLADLQVDSGKGQPVTIAKGLAGYVLARSSMSWVAPGLVQSAGVPLQVTAQGDLGPINARALPETAR
jgi:fimbrial chaperone protein